MPLPPPVTYCLQALEDAGFQCYAVGGCVRDSLLGLTPHDYDLCTDAAPAETARVFGAWPLVRSGEKHGTVGVVMDNQVIEITTFRTEGGYADSRHPDWVKFVPSLKEDLARRDFTVNAMAYNPKTGYADPFGGREDLQNRVLRCVGDPAARFSEDALRILRGVRFALRFGLTPDAATEQAMFSLAGLMDSLARERVFDELCKLLPLVSGEDLLTYAPVLTAAIPELAPCVGFRQYSPHHAYDVYTHTAFVVAAAEPQLALRWAALLHDIGKPGTFTLDEGDQGHFLGHAQASARLAEAVLRRLKAPTALREQVVVLIAQHMTPLPPDRQILRRRLGKYGEPTVRLLLALQKADFGSKGTGKTEDASVFSQVEACLDAILAEQDCLTVKDLAVNGRDLLGLGFAPGPRLGECLEYLLGEVQRDSLPNDREPLLHTAKERFL